MMRRRERGQGQFFYAFDLDKVMPADHLVQQIDGVLDLDWVHKELAPYYSHTGRPSIDPVLMIRMLLVGYVFAIRSEGQLCSEVQVNLASRRERKKVEMRFARMKRIFKLDRLRLRGLSGAKDEVLLTATAQNVRRLVKFLCRPPPSAAVPSVGSGASAAVNSLRCSHRRAPIPDQNSNVGSAAKDSRVLQHNREYSGRAVSKRDRQFCPNSDIRGSSLCAQSDAPAAGYPVLLRRGSGEDRIVDNE
jgi:hypothetical protein